MHVNWQTSLMVHCPALLQMACTMALSLARRPQDSAFGLHTPVQLLVLPLVVQTDGHAEVVHWPVALHVCSVVPEHCVAPGLQTPLHFPALQTKGQGWPSTHLPAWQLCGVRLLHCTLPSEQEPAHDPWSQTNGHTAPALVQVPSGLQVCGWLPLHCLESGTHTPVQAFARQTYGQVATSCHCDCELHTCKRLPLQRVSPGLHMPVHTSFTQANVHAMPASQVPSFLQVYCIVPSHLVDPGLHTPAQTSVAHR
jgi:hypothetical protein